MRSIIINIQKTLGNTTFAEMFAGCVYVFILLHFFDLLPSVDQGIVSSPSPFLRLYNVRQFNFGRVKKKSLKIEISETFMVFPLNCPLSGLDIDLLRHYDKIQ